MDVSFDMDNSFNEVRVTSHVIAYAKIFNPIENFVIFGRLLLQAMLLCMVDSVRLQHLIEKN